MVELGYHNFAIPNQIIDLSNDHQWLLKTIWVKSLWGTFK